MSTYADNGYIYSRATIPHNEAPCADFEDFFDKLRQIMEEGGWDIKTVQGVMVIDFESEPAFPICTLGTDNWPFYSVSSATVDGSEITHSVLVYDDSGDECCSDGEGGFTDLLGCEPAGIEDTLVLEPYGFHDNLEDKMDGVSRGLAAAHGLNGFGISEWKEETSDPNEEGEFVVSKFYIVSNPFCFPDTAIGNQHNADINLVPNVQGGGFLATSADETLQLYFEYRQGGGVTETVLIHVRADPQGFTGLEVTPTGEDTIVLTDGANGETVEVLIDTFAFDGVHPWEIVNNENTTIFTQAWRLSDREHDIWCNGNTLMIHPTEETESNDLNAIYTSIKTKDLDAGNTVINTIHICSAIDGQDSLRERNSLRSNASLLRFNNEYTFNAETQTPDGLWGPLLVPSLGNTNYLAINHIPREGTFWLDGTAEIAEPWVGCNLFNSGSGDRAPIIGQLWDACIPFRASVGSLPNTSDVFFWDGELWKTLQIDKFLPGGFINGSGPPSSLALRIAGGDAADFTFNPIPVESVEYEFDNGTIEITITRLVGGEILDPGYVIVYTPEDNRIIFDTNIVEFSAAQTEKVVEFDYVDLEINEDVELVVEGSTRVTIIVSFTDGS